MPAKFRAYYKPKDTRPHEPILIGRAQSQARVTLQEARELLIELESAILQAERASIMKFSERG